MERINWLQRRQESYATMYNFLLLPRGTKARGRYIYGEESLECVLGVTRLMISEEIDCRGNVDPCKVFCKSDICM